MTDTTLHLFRACRRNKWGKNNEQAEKNVASAEAAGTLFPDYEGFQRKDGSFRAPDVTTFTDKNAVVWVQGVNDVAPNGRAYIDDSEGVSLSSARGKFGYAGWFYLLLPKGTSIPDSLDVKQTGRDASHYSLRCKNRMRKDAYEGALNTLARAALAKAVELKLKSLYFTEE